MSLPKVLGFFAFAIFAVILAASLWKKTHNPQEPHVFTYEPVEVVLEDAEVEKDREEVFEVPLKEDLDDVKEEERLSSTPHEELPQRDCIQEFFNTREPRLPIVQTVTYKAKVPWLKGRPAWIADYSTHYKTSRHFIARSLNGAPNYDKQDIKNGDKFNVFREDKNIEFYLLVDLTTSNMWFYYIDGDTNERVLVKNYRIGLGRPDPSSPSGYLTPTGKFTLGDKIAVYRPKMLGVYQGQKVEMVRVFGTRWIPFAEEISDCTACASGLGIHGLPLEMNGSGEFVESGDSLGKYESDGCIRMATKDMEELFSIIISRPATIELVKGFHSARLPGKEAASH